MKTRNILLVIIILLPIGLTAQSDFAISATYSPYEYTIFIHLVNNTDKPMRIRNSFLDTGSGSIVQFHLKDKAGKEISVYDAVFGEGVNYQHFVDINPRSAKTIKFLLQFMVPSSRDVSEVYSVEASCFIRYLISEKNEYDYFDKILTINTKQDLMIGPRYDTYAQNMIIYLKNTSDYEMKIRNSGSAVKLGLLNQEGTEFATNSYSFLIKGTGAPDVIRIAPNSEVRLDYDLSQLSAGLADPSQVSVEVKFSAYYDIPAKNIAKAFSGRTYKFKLK